MKERRESKKPSNEGKTREFLDYCKTIDFGKIELSKIEGRFYQRLNNENLRLCRSLPTSAQTDSILFLMRYSGLRPGDELDFYAKYYPPIWSILYWLSRNHAHGTKRSKKEDVRNAVTAQSMALLLHSLDDHLIDGQVSVSPLTLLLRTQAWTIMEASFSNLAHTVPAGEKTVRSFIDDYYSSLQDSQLPESLDNYCRVFRRQMAILMVAPVLLSLKMNRTPSFSRDIEMAYGSFGIAWRLLDDIVDLGDDIKKGTHSSIYLCLANELKARWDSNTMKRQAPAVDSTNIIVNHVLEYGIIDKIKERICAELEAAASIVEAHQIKGLAREFRRLAHPLLKSGSTQEEDNGRNGIPMVSQ